MFQLQEVIQGAVTSLKTERRSKKTVVNYNVTFNQLINFVIEKNGTTVLSDEDFKSILTDFLAYLSDEDINNYSIATINQKRFAIKYLCKHLYSEELISKDYSLTIDRLNHNREENYTILSSEEIKKILKYLKNDIDQVPDEKKYYKIRNRFLFNLFLWTGARVSELAQLRWIDIDIGSSEIKVFGKGRKPRTVAISSILQAEISYYKDWNYKFSKDFKQWERLGTSEYVFPSLYDEEDNHISVRRIQILIKNIIEKSGIEKEITPHKMRHTFASFAIASGIDIKSLQDLLGHSSSNITHQIYIHSINRARTQEEINKISFV